MMAQLRYKLEPEGLRILFGLTDTCEVHEQQVYC